MITFFENQHNRNFIQSCPYLTSYRKFTYVYHLRMFWKSGPWFHSNSDTLLQSYFSHLVWCRPTWQYVNWRVLAKLLINCASLCTCWGYVDQLSRGSRQCMHNYGRMLVLINVVIFCAGPVTAVGERKCQHLWPFVVYIWWDGQDASWHYRGQQAVHWALYRDWWHWFQKVNILVSQVSI